jgi:hypothetical protein
VPLSQKIGSSEHDCGYGKYRSKINDQREQIGGKSGFGVHLEEFSFTNKQNGIEININPRDTIT